MTKEPLTKGEWWKIARFWIYLFFGMFAVLVILGIALGPLTCGVRSAQKSACLQTAHAINLALYSYSQDHSGNYPDGKTSTEVFQQLVDQGYITDRSIFYLAYMRMPGKVPPQGKLLKPENICWDVTAGVDSSAPDILPMVFLTGYKVTYQAGADAVILHPPPPRTWEDWWNGLPSWEPFMAFGSKNNTASSVIANPDGHIPNFIPADFDPKGKTYRQLTP